MMQQQITKMIITINQIIVEKKIDIRWKVDGIL